MPREDRIVIKGLLLNGKHGVLPQEQMHCQPFKVDITLGVNSLLPAAEKDDLALTVDYGAVIDVATNVVASSPKQLVETLASRFPGQYWPRSQKYVGCGAVGENDHRWPPRWLRWGWRYCDGENRMSDIMAFGLGLKRGRQTILPATGGTGFNGRERLQW